MPVESIDTATGGPDPQQRRLLSRPVEVAEHRAIPYGIVGVWWRALECCLRRGGSSAAKPPNSFRHPGVEGISGRRPGGAPSRNILMQLARGQQPL